MKAETPLYMLRYQPKQTSRWVTHGLVRGHRCALGVYRALIKDGNYGAEMALHSQEPSQPKTKPAKKSK